MKKRNVLNSPRLLELKKRKRRALLYKFLFFLLGLVTIFACLAYISRLDTLNISDIEFSGNKTIDTDTLRNTVQQETSGNYLWLFPKTNTLAYPGNAIKKDLMDKFKRIKSVNTSINSDRTLAIALTEREPEYTWCGNAPLDQVALSETKTEHEKCYFVDKDGYIFDEAPYFSGEVYFKFYGLIAGDPMGLYFSQQNFQQLISFKDILIKLNLKPASLYIENNGDIDIYLSRESFSTTEPKIILSSNSDFETDAENLETALTTEPLQSEFKDKYSSLDYINLRFENRVYYKFK